MQELLAKFAMVDGYEETDFGPTTSTVGSAQMPVPIRDSVTNGESVGDQPASGGGKSDRHHDIAVDDSGSNGSHHGPEMASEAQSLSQVSI